MRVFKNLNLSSQEIKFIKNAIYVWTIGQIILHFCLLFLSIATSVFLSNLSSLPLRYYFYGKNVFDLEKHNVRTSIKFIFSSIILWILNTLGTSLIHSFGLNKNISALIMIPFVAWVSFFLQKNYVFKISK